MLTASQLVRISSRPENANMRSVLDTVNQYGPRLNLERPHRVAQYLAQIIHESGRFQFDREVWGPTAAQKRYEGRKDLGNIQPGDGSKFRGYTAGQITGRANTTDFYEWCVNTFPELKVPNFVASPQLMNTDPWEGLGPLWFWDANRVYRYADQGDVEMVSRTWNGGTNGLADRYDLYDRASLVLLGRNPDDIRGFQASAGLVVDGISGPNTRRAMHNALKTLPYTIIVGTGGGAGGFPISNPVASDNLSPVSDDRLAKIADLARQIQDLAGVED